MSTRQVRTGHTQSALVRRDTAAGIGHSAVNRVVHDVLQGLRRGNYRPGQRLVAADIAAKLSVSAVPVREALHILSGRGIVELIPQRGARIRELSQKDILDTMLIWATVSQLNYSCAAETVKLANGSESGMTTFVRRIESAKDDLQASLQSRISIDLFASIQSLYETCAALNGNDYFLAIRSPLHVELYYRQVAEVLPGPLWERYVGNISSVAEAILTGDPKQVNRVFAGHKKMVSEYLRLRFHGSSEVPQS